LPTYFFGRDVVDTASFPARRRGRSPGNCRSCGRRRRLAHDTSRGTKKESSVGTQRPCEGSRLLLTAFTHTQTASISAKASTFFQPPAYIFSTGETGVSLPGPKPWAPHCGCCEAMAPSCAEKCLCSAPQPRLCYCRASHFVGWPRQPRPPRAPGRCPQCARRAASEDRACWELKPA
jgi:hypothetical protein